MATKLITPPAAEPVTLADLKLHLRIDGTAEDVQLGTLLVAARATVERLTRRLMITQSWRVTLDRVPETGVILLPIAPVQTVTALRVVAANGTTTVWPGAEMVLDLVGEPARIAFKGALPAPGVPMAGIEIDVVAGYGAAPANVPPALAQAVKLLAAHWYERRGDAPDAELPADVSVLVDAHRAPRLVA